MNIDKIINALEKACEICNAVPEGAHFSEDPVMKQLGILVNENHGFTDIADALCLAYKLEDDLALAEIDEDANYKYSQQDNLIVVKQL